MAAFQALYLQAPYFIWLALGCLFVALNLATGQGRLVWPALAAVAAALLGAAGLRLGFAIEALVFAALSLAGLAAAARIGLGREPAIAPQDAREARPQASGEPTAAAGARLLGRIGRTTCAFANGVGRVWIDGAEWAAELERGEDPVPEGAAVRVTKVIGGVRLQVHPLAFG